MSMPSAIILSIGQEMTEGKFSDTNSTYIAEKITEIGISVARIIILPDKKDAIVAALWGALNDADIIISTGGLGPTDDDLTREAFSVCLNMPLMKNNEELNRIKELFKNRNIPYSDDNERQAYFPESSQMILNRYGTASGFFIKKENKMLFAIPGVPYEAYRLLEEFIFPQIKSAYHLLTAITTVKTFGISEAGLNEKFRKLITRKDMEWGTLAKKDGIYLCIRSFGENAEKTVAEVKQELQVHFARYIWGWDDEQLAESVGKLLVQKGYTLSTAESCTGGLIGKLLTDIPGSSRYYSGGAVVYSNEMKTHLLGVAEEIIKNHGAVSEPVVQILAENAKSIFHTECSISVSGIAGPDGGSEEKPVGTVWIAISTPQKTFTQKYIFPGNRELIRERTAYYALSLLRKLLLEE